MRLEGHSEARAEFFGAVSFFEAPVPGPGVRVGAEIERCPQTLLDTPLVGSPYGRRLRKFTVGDQFPYSIVYAVLADGLYILAYAHGSRRPGYWRARSPTKEL